MSILARAICCVWAFLRRTMLDIWYGLKFALTGQMRPVPVRILPAMPAYYAARGLSCVHPGAVPVDLLLTGERVAWWCENCQTQLPADFDPAAKVTVRAWSGGGGGTHIAQPAQRRHWHPDSANCPSCRGSDASAAARCLCGQCTGLAAASVMGPPAADAYSACMDEMNGRLKRIFGVPPPR